MSRRMKTDRAELKERILSAAEQIVELEGEKGLSVRKITTRIGCAVGMLYKIFAGLDEMILCINGRTLDRLYSSLEQKMQQCSYPEQMIYELHQECLAFIKENQNLWTLLHEPRNVALRNLPLWYQGKLRKLIDLFDEALRPIVPDCQQERRTAAKVLWGSLYGLYTFSILGAWQISSRQELALLMSSLFENYLAGLKQLEKNKYPNCAADF